MMHFIYKRLKKCRFSQARRTTLRPPPALWFGCSIAKAPGFELRSGLARSTTTLQAQQQQQQQQLMATAVPETEPPPPPLLLLLPKHRGA
jgi:hypothetical protein